MSEFDKIYRDTYENTLRYVVSHCKNIEDVNDIIQEIYFSFNEALKKNPKINDPKNYIMGIAKKKVNDYYRGIYRFKGLKIPLLLQKDGQTYDLSDEYATNYNLEDTVLSLLELKKILKKINKKDSLRVKIFYMYYYYEWTFKEIAQELNMNESTVKNKLYQTLREVQRDYKKEGEVHV